MVLQRSWYSSLWFYKNLGTHIISFGIEIFYVMFTPLNCLTFVFCLTVMLKEIDKLPKRVDNHLFMLKVILHVYIFQFIKAKYISIGYVIWWDTRLTKILSFIFIISFFHFFPKDLNRTMETHNVLCFKSILHAWWFKLLNEKIVKC